jgi:hypothetical protein
MDSTTNSASNPALPFADMGAQFETMIHNIGIAIIAAIVISVALVIFRAVTATKASTKRATHNWR